MPDVISGLTWVQILCKGYQQTTVNEKVLLLFYIDGYMFQLILSFEVLVLS